MVVLPANVRSPPMRWTMQSSPRRSRKGSRRRRSLRGHGATRRLRRRPRPSSFRNSGKAGPSNCRRRMPPVPVARECRTRGGQATSVERLAATGLRAPRGRPGATVSCQTIARVRSPNHRRRPKPTTSVAKGSDSTEEEQGESDRGDRMANGQRRHAAGPTTASPVSRPVPMLAPRLPERRAVRWPSPSPFRRRRRRWSRSSGRRLSPRRTPWGWP